MVGAILVGLIAGCGDDGSSAGPFGAGGVGEPDAGTLVEGDGYRGVLLDAGPTFEGAEGFVPTEADVARFEERLPAALPAAVNASGEEVTPDDLGGYVRQYAGVSGGSDGGRQLVVAGICDTAAADGMSDWEHGWIEVSDGGACFWDATMDLATGEILHVYFHGSG
ncbi:MAG TPA: hypothetical protein VK611_00450 [Acidimicrobiales bacterium]|nr:hypothetical protein [Acidimicrobiales bacterium]